MRTVSTLTRMLFWCLFPSLLRNTGNKHQVNPLVSAETVCHSITYIIFYFFKYGCMAIIKVLVNWTHPLNMLLIISINVWMTTCGTFNETPKVPHILPQNSQHFFSSPCHQKIRNLFHQSSLKCISQKHINKYYSHVSGFIYTYISIYLIWNK